MRREESTEAEVTRAGGRSGTKEIEFWAACLRARHDPNSDHAGMYATAVPSNLASRLAELESGGGGRVVRPPTDLPANMVRFLNVECAFTTLAATGAEEMYGRRERLDDDGRRKFDELARIGRARLRALCYQVYVDRRKRSEFRDEAIYVGMAIYGVSRAGFQEWLKRRIRAVKEEIERQKR